MYRKILVAVDNSPADDGMLRQVTELARHFQSEVILLHVADGWAARYFDQLKLTESQEMKEDQDYLEKTAGTLRDQGLMVNIKLALGNPPAEILKMAKSEQCDLIAMAGHGHRLFGDIFHGSTITQVRHRTSIPLLVVRTPKKKK
jgi:nucleotide-binding universal stress UspA family protein